MQSELLLFRIDRPYLLSNFCNKNSLWLDPTLNGIDYTYHNDNLGNFSLIDYFVCSPKLVGSSIYNQILNHGDNISDHLAIMCNFKPNETVSASKMNECVLSKLLWDKANLGLYQAVLCDALASISLPLDALLCKQVGCQRHSVELERYYTDIVGCLNTAAKQCVPSSKPRLQKFWWTPELDELKLCIYI